MSHLSKRDIRNLKKEKAGLCVCVLTLEERRERERADGKLLWVSSAPVAQHFTLCRTFERNKKVQKSVPLYSEREPIFHVILSLISYSYW